MTIYRKCRWLPYTKPTLRVSARQQFVYEGKGMVVKVKVWIGILDIALFTREDS